MTKLNPFDTKRVEPKANAKVSARSSFPFYRGSEAMHSAGEAYMSALAVKAAFDAMEEIPDTFMPIYRQAMKVMNLAGETKQQAGQLADQLSKLARQTGQM